MPFITVGISLCGGELEWAESSAVDIALDAQYPFHESGVCGQQAHAPSWHVVAFRHGVELNAAFLGAWNLKDAQVFSLIENEAVGVVIHDDDVVAAGKIHKLLIELTGGTTAGRHVGIVCPHDFHTVQIHRLQLFEVGLPSFLFQQVVIQNLGAEDAVE